MSLQCQLSSSCLGVCSSLSATELSPSARILLAAVVTSNRLAAIYLLFAAHMALILIDDRPLSHSQLVHYFHNPVEDAFRSLESHLSEGVIAESNGQQARLDGP